MDAESSFLGVKKPGLEDDHTPPFSSEVKNGGAIPPVPHTSSWRSVQGQLYLSTSIQFRQAFLLFCFIDCIYGLFKISVSSSDYVT
jgi:hypothetical protein